MGRYSSDTGGTFQSAPVGTHVARCIKIVDIGTQHGEYKGEPTRRNQVIVTWELPDELISIDNEMKPVIASRFYTNSLGEKANLRHDLESWRGRTFTKEELTRFDLESILGKPCLLTIVGGEGDKTKVANVSGLPKNVVCPDQVNKSFTFWLDEYTEEKFEALSEGVQKLIKKSEEYPQIVDGHQVPSNGDRDINADIDPDEVPF